MEKKYIHSVVRITNNQLIHDGDLLLTRSAEDGSWPLEIEYICRREVQKMLKFL